MFKNNYVFCRLLKKNYFIKVRNKKFRRKLEKKKKKAKCGNKIKGTTLSSSASTLEPCRVVLEHIHAIDKLSARECCAIGGTTHAQV